MEEDITITRLFWEVMGPNGGGTPLGNLAQAIDAAYGSFEVLKPLFQMQLLTNLVPAGLGFVFKKEAK